MTHAVPMLDDVTAIVLAGGRSARFGSDKLAFDVDGRTMLDRSIDAVRVVTARMVVVLAPDTVRSFDQPVPIEVVHDGAAYEGPLAGLAAALGTVTTPTALVVAGDMPRMASSVLLRLSTTVGSEHPAVNLEVPGRIQPLPMAIRVDAAKPAAAALLARGERSLRALLADLGSTSIPAPVWLSLDPAGGTILDIDRPNDLPRRR